MSELYAYDIAGNKIYQGDVVMCLSTEYYMYAYSDKAVIRGIYKNCILVDNDRSPSGIGQYLPGNWKLHEKRNPTHFIKEPKEIGMTSATAKTLQVAFLIPEGMDKAEFMEYMSDVKKDKDSLMICCDTPHKLKADIRKRINENPSERWYHVNTGIIAEISAPPVTFRSW